jgi:hypothetical protein
MYGNVTMKPLCITHIHYEQEREKEKGKERAPFSRTNVKLKG